jgi:hypothetical protein
MHECPHCGKPGITTLRRFTLGTAIPATCRSCGGKIVASSNRAFLVLVPYVVYVVLVSRVRPVWLAIALVSAGALVVLALWSKLVPLEKSQ